MSQVLFIDLAAKATFIILLLFLSPQTEKYYNSRFFLGLTEKKWFRIFPKWIDERDMHTEVGGIY